MQLNNLCAPTWRHRLALRILSIFPEILLIALCNSRAMGDGQDRSDIDLFIITRKNRLWTGRFLVTCVTLLLGVRRKNTHGVKKGSLKYIRRTKDKFCLSFFVTEEGMHLGHIRIDNDLYLDKWIETLIPLMDRGNTYETFFMVNTAAEEIPQYFSEPGLFGNILEKCIKILWLPKTLKTYEGLGKPWGVIISDTMLKFHDNDQRKIYRDKLQKE